MKKIVLLVTLAIVFLALPAFAAAPGVLTAGGGTNTAQYHSYDGLICTDCHTLHNSEDGAAITTTSTVDGTPTPGSGPNRDLLKRADWTDMCLSCHKEGFNTAATAALDGVTVDGATGWTAPIVFSTQGTGANGCYTAQELVALGKSMPAGDFCYSNADMKKGHNPAYTKGTTAQPSVVTSLFMVADTILGATPPGGSITDKEWSCHSCHGMHSRFSGGYTAFRQVKRKVNGVVHTADVTGFGVETSAGDYTLAQQAAGYEPIKSNSRGNINGTTYQNTRADGNPVEGADLFAAEGATNKNVYRGGFSSFCGTCHGNIHGESTDAGATTANQGTNVKSAAGAWIRHPTNLSLDATGLATKSSGDAKYGRNAYRVQVTYQNGTSQPNAIGYDWKYPLVQPDADFTVTRTSVDSASTSLVSGVRIMCLTCHKAHASQYENMTRWDTNGHAFIANGAYDFTGVASTADNAAYGCGKCHQKGGAKAFVKGF